MERIEALISEHQIQTMATDMALEIPTITNYTNRREFIKLPLEEKRNILAKQAEVIRIFWEISTKNGEAFGDNITPLRLRSG